MKLQRHWYFLMMFVTYILIGVIVDCFDLGFKEALAAVTWKTLIRAAFASFIMMLIFTASPKEKTKA